MKRAGERVGQTGLYTVSHQGHRSNHEAILWGGETFPNCRICGRMASFQFLRPVPEYEESEHVGYDRDFMESVLAAGEPDCSELFA